MLKMSLFKFYTFEQQIPKVSTKSRHGITSKKPDHFTVPFKTSEEAAIFAQLLTFSGRLKRVKNYYLMLVDCLNDIYEHYICV